MTSWEAVRYYHAACRRCWTAEDLESGQSSRSSRLWDTYRCWLLPDIGSSWKYFRPSVGKISRPVAAATGSTCSWSYVIARGCQALESLDFIMYFVRYIAMYHAEETASFTDLWPPTAVWTRATFRPDLIGLNRHHSEHRLLHALETLTGK